MRQFLGKVSFLGMYFVAALVMGAFVSIYNYLSFILESPRFGLPHYLVAMIFMMYTVGVAGSILTGKLSDKYNPAMLLQGSLMLMVVGLLFLLVMQLWTIVVGLGILTFAFFSAHTMASRIVSINARQAKSSATSLYWLFYYAGSSVAGSLTGIVLSEYGWNLFVWVIISLVVTAFFLSIISTEKMAIKKVLLLSRIHYLSNK